MFRPTVMSFIVIIAVHSWLSSFSWFSITCIVGYPQQSRGQSRGHGAFTF